MQYGATPLHFAALVGRSDLVHVLLMGGADPHRRTREGVTPYDIARAEGRLAVVRQLREASAHVDGVDLSWGVLLEGELQAKRGSGFSLFAWRNKFAVLSRPARALLLWSGTRTKPESAIHRIPMDTIGRVQHDVKGGARRFTIRAAADSGEPLELGAASVEDAALWVSAIRALQAEVVEEEARRAAETDVVAAAIAPLAAERLETSAFVSRILRHVGRAEAREAAAGASAGASGAGKAAPEPRVAPTAANAAPSAAAATTTGVGGSSTQGASAAAAAAAAAPAASMISSAGGPAAIAATSPPSLALVPPAGAAETGISSSASSGPSFSPASPPPPSSGEAGSESGSLTASQRAPASASAAAPAGPASLEKRQRSALIIQRVFRGHWARRKLRGWIRVVDDSVTPPDIYWYNVVTEVSSWTRPSVDFTPSSASDTAPAEGASPGDAKAFSPPDSGATGSSDAVPPL